MLPGGKIPIKHTHQARFKQRMVDFIVEEKLPYSLTKRGIRLYVQIEKRNINSIDMVRDIGRALGLRPKQIGIGGLKDKHAIAKQRLCLGVRDLGRTPEKMVLSKINQVAKVLQYGYYHLPLNISSNISNQFQVRLRFDQLINNETKGMIDNQIDRVAKEGFPNYFGDQRFGFTGQNNRVGQDLLEGKNRGLPLVEKKFKLQAYSSWLFNQYVDFRLKSGSLNLLAGDIVSLNSGLVLRNGKQFQSLADWKESGFLVSAIGRGVVNTTFDTDIRTHITGPFIGFNTLLSPSGTVAGKLEQQWLEHFELDQGSLRLYRDIALFGLRRVLRVIPEGVKHNWQGNDVVLSFILPKSSYASTMVDEIFG